MALLKITCDAFARHFSITTVVFQNLVLRRLNRVIVCMAHERLSNGEKFGKLYRAPA